MRVQSPISGNMRGSVGGLVFQFYHGKTFGRSKPAIFHYGPTPAQAAQQTKYYGIRTQWNPIYRILKPYFPESADAQANPFNTLSDGIFRVLRTNPVEQPVTILRKFGTDVNDRLLLRLGQYTLYYEDPYYYITFYDFDFTAKVDFTPVIAHALYICQDLQQIQYCAIQYNAEHLTFIFDNSEGWFPDHSFDMYVAISNAEFFSNFFY